MLVSRQSKEIFVLDFAQDVMMQYFNM